MEAFGCATVASVLNIIKKVLFLSKVIVTDIPVTFSQLGVVLFSWSVLCMELKSTRSPSGPCGPCGPLAHCVAITVEIRLETRIETTRPAVNVVFDTPADFSASGIFSLFFFQLYSTLV